MPLFLYSSGVFLVTVLLIPGPIRLLIEGLTGMQAASYALVLIGIYLLAALRLVLWPPSRECGAGVIGAG